MSDAVFSVSFAGPLVTIQDAGRPRNMRFGVPASGPMDRLAFDAANAALGNVAGPTGIEVSLGGLTLTCTEGAVTLAVTGGDFIVDHAGQKYASWVVLTLQSGERLSIRSGNTGSWAYVAFAGNLQSETWLGSQATHSTSGFGGGTVQTGQKLHVEDAILCDDRLGNIAKPEFIKDGPVRVVLGPQEKYFSEETLEQFCAESFKVSGAYDRMGMRLDGPRLPLNGALSIPSEPIVRGSVQVSGDGVPTVLLADHQTVGGYPKIATVLSSDTDRLSQYRAGQSMNFTSISSDVALSEARAFYAGRRRYLEEVSTPRGSLAQRLMRENLNHGCIFD